MLARSDHSLEYSDACRRQLDAEVAAYQELVTAGADLDTFEPVFFDNLVLVGS